MDDPTIEGELITNQYENPTRVGLDRVGAKYAHSIPIAVALYNDLWQANKQSMLAARFPGNLGKFGPFLQLYPAAPLADPAHAVLEVRIALEMLGNAHGSFCGTTALSAAKATLWHRAANIATYLTTPLLRQLTLQRVAGEIEAGDEEVVLLAHGLGSLIAYELLLSRPDLPVRCLVTLGSPLGLMSVRTALAEAQGRAETAPGTVKLPFPNQLPRWLNLYNSADTVSASHLLSHLYTPASSKDLRRVEDIDTGNLGLPFLSNYFCGNHPATYLASKAAGMVLRSVVED